MSPEQIADCSTPGRCMICREDITPENNGMPINNGDFWMCDDCHLIAYDVHIMKDLLYFNP